MRRALILIALISALAVRPGGALASTIVGMSQESKPDQWLVGLEVNLTAGAPTVQQSFTFSNSVLTKRLQMSYRCNQCSTVLMIVRMSNGTVLGTPTTLQNTVNSNVVEYFVDSKTVTSITVSLNSAGTGNFEVQMMGTNLP